MKKNLFAKLLSLGMAALVSSSVLYGCKKADNSTNTSTKTRTSNKPGWKKDAKKKVTLDWYVNFSWFATKWGKDVTSKYVSDKTGVNLNIIAPSGNESEKLNTMIASDSLPDIITLNWNDDGVKKMIEAGQIEPLDELANKYDPYFNTVADKSKLNWYKQDDGHVYGYPNSSTSPADFKKYGNKITSNQTFMVRKDIYEAIGKPDMSTPEGFLNALKAAKEKFPTVNGQPLIPIGLHEFGDTGNYSLQDYLANFLAVPREKNGKLYDRIDDPDYINWLRTFRKANQMGLLSQDVFVDKRAQMEEKMGQGRYFALLYQRSDMTTQEGNLYKKDPKSIYIAINGPANSAKDAPKLAGVGISGWTLQMITKNCKDKKRAVEFFSYLISEEGQKDLYLGKKGVTYDTINGKDQFKPDVLKLRDSDRTAFDKKYGASLTFWMMQDTNMILKWQPETAEPFKQLEDWTKGKVVDYSKYDNITPPVDSDEGEINTAINEEWGKTLTKLLLAKSDSQFDSILKAFNTKKKALGYDKLMKYENKEMSENGKKLGYK
ncbi:extracellular solute-binding protein [Clostridium oryzae]|uniref:Lipoprotein LipO n=1 Tax=Clostridium oryzae TaxID=1450648 RepID=A0A1V4IZ09_9CLOT|nr:extracellular solute-binding protein [Clostridium oryzae]OPJ65015.1 lipoprotein LipO precursor [Clostridium oryzae]